MSEPRRPRLLVVDDQPINVRVMHQIFGADHEVLMACNGLQALEICRQQRPDLVLLDIEMPDLDGTTVCLRMKDDPLLCDIPVIFVTAADTAAEETRGFEAGGVDFIRKPVNPVVVRARVRTHLTLKEQADRLRNLAYVDGLTGIANRRRFEQALAHELRVCRRSGEGLAVAIVDVDHFKCFNDHYGHQAGDDALRAVGHAIDATLRRPRDLAARWGGEEFACVVPAVEHAAAAALFESLRASVEALALPHAGSLTASVVTVSLGFHFGQVEGAGTTPALWISQADRALYAAKTQGRNRIHSGASPV